MINSNRIIYASVFIVLILMGSYAVINNNLPAETDKIKQHPASKTKHTQKNTLITDKGDDTIENIQKMDTREEIVVMDTGYHLG